MSMDVIALIRSKLLPCFDGKLSPTFGRSAQRMVVERLRADGDLPESVANGVLLHGCELMIGYLDGGGRVESPDALFASFCCTALEGVRWERAQQVTFEIMRLLEGEVSLKDSPLRENAKILTTVRQALDMLPESYARFLHLDLLERRSEEEICEELGLSDHREYIYLKRFYLENLRLAIERLLRG